MMFSTRALAVRRRTFSNNEMESHENKVCRHCEPLECLCERWEDISIQGLKHTQIIEVTAAALSRAQYKTWTVDKVMLTKSKLQVQMHKA